MSEYIISMFIDDELDLDDKIEFVEKVHGDVTFKDETVSLLNQEKELRQGPVDRVPHVATAFPTRHRFRIFHPAYVATAALAVAVVILAFTFLVQQQTGPSPYRFVIYRPDVTQAEIIGTFTDWQRVPMNALGSSGYWEISLDIPRGEHRFTYILEGEKRYADPTILTRESDDFGGENSILSLNNKV
jgi:hypothetical protein